MIGDINLVASLTDFSVYMIFIAVNASLITLRFRAPAASRTFVRPLALRSVPLLPILGTGVVMLMLVILDGQAWIIGPAIIAAGQSSFPIAFVAPPLEQRTDTTISAFARKPA